MDSLEPAHLRCPYCGEMLAVVIDPSAGDQEYIEDCQVCCKPITFRVRIGADGEPSIDARGEDA